MKRKGAEAPGSPSHRVQPKSPRRNLPDGGDTPGLNGCNFIYVAP